MAGEALSAGLKAYQINGVVVARDGLVEDGKAVVPFCETCNAQDLPTRSSCLNANSPKHDAQCSLCCRHYHQCPGCMAEKNNTKLNNLLVRKSYNKADRKSLLNHLFVCKYEGLIPCSSVRLSSQEQHSAVSSASDSTIDAASMHVRLMPCAHCDDLVEGSKMAAHAELCNLRRSDPAAYKDSYAEQIRTRSETPPSLMDTPSGDRMPAFSPSNNPPASSPAGTKRSFEGSPAAPSKKAKMSPKSSPVAVKAGGRKDSLTLPQMQSPNMPTPLSSFRDDAKGERILQPLTAIDLGDASTGAERDVKSKKKSKASVRSGGTSPLLDVDSDDDAAPPRSSQVIAASFEEKLVPNQTLRDAVGAIMKKNGLKAASVCKDTGIAKSTFNDWLHGKGTDSKGTMRIKLVKWMDECYGFKIKGDGATSGKSSSGKSPKGDQKKSAPLPSPTGSSNKKASGSKKSEGALSPANSPSSANGARQHVK